HTERMLGALGAPVVVRSATELAVTAGAPSPFELTVPGDPSSAAFWVVGAALAPGSSVVVEGMSLNPTRVEHLDVLRRMGVSIEVETTGAELDEPSGNVTVTAGGLRGTVIDATEGLIDELPALAVAAAFADGVTEVRGAGELRVKESDRIATIT